MALGITPAHVTWALRGNLIAWAVSAASDERIWPTRINMRAIGLNRAVVVALAWADLYPLLDLSQRPAAPEREVKVNLSGQ